MGSKFNRVCFTGHRPDKLVGKEAEVRDYLSRQIDQAVADGLTIFICGMCPGVDILAGEIVLEKRKANPDIKLIAAMPYPKFAFNWADGLGQRVQRVCSQADLIQPVSPRYTGRGVFQIRNQWMIDHSCRLIAYWDGTPGGTRNTVFAGRESGIQIVYSHPTSGT